MKSHHFARLVEPPYTWWVPRAELDAARRILPLLSGLEGGTDRITPVKESPCKSVYRLPGESLGTAIHVKVYRRNSWRYLLRTPPGTREARAMFKLQRVGVPVTDLVAVGLRRRFPFGVENLLIVRSPTNVWTLGRWCLGEFREHGEKARRRVTPVLTKILTAVRRMHEAGVWHGDLNPGNILIDLDSNEFYFIDFHRSRSLWVRDTRRRTEDLCKLLLQLQTYYQVNELFDIICAYAPGSGSLSHTVRTHWEETTTRIRQRWVRHVVDQCCDTRTHFRCAESDTTTMYMDCQYNPEAVFEFALGENNTSEWRCEELTGSAEEARRCWRDAVQRSVLGETWETPVALVCRAPGLGPHLLIWDPQRPPRYRLSYLLSLDVFDPSEDDLALGRGSV